VSLGGKGEPQVQEFFKNHPFADCYSTRLAGTKSIPGTIEVKTDDKGKNNTVKIINMFAQFYPNAPKYLNDDVQKRKNWFTEALDRILEFDDISSLSFPKNMGKYSTIDISDRYISILDDFYNKYLLKHKKKINMYDSDGGIIKTFNEHKTTYADPITSLSGENSMSPEYQHKINIVMSVDIENLYFFDSKATPVVEKPIIKFNKPNKKCLV
jgi:hypothetical protein